MINIERVYYCIRDNPDCTIADIVEETGLDRNAVDFSVRRLIGLTLVGVSNIERDGKKGKPPRQFRLGERRAHPTYWRQPQQQKRKYELAAIYRARAAKRRAAQNAGPFSTIIQQLI